MLSGPWFTQNVSDLGPVVRRVDNFIQLINPYPVDKTGVFLILIGQRANFIHWIGIFPLDKVIHSLCNWALVGNRKFSLGDVLCHVHPI